MFTVRGDAGQGSLGHFQAVSLPWVLYMWVLFWVFDSFSQGGAVKKILIFFKTGIFTTDFEGHTHHFAICVTV